MRYRYRALAALYALIGVVTFGHSAASQSQWYDANCARAIERIGRGSQCYAPIPIGAIISGAAWPFYWSWELWTPPPSSLSVAPEKGEK